ncbi:hypothetical protein C8R43DRAFT_877640, partial [Mycena crocata]
PLIDAAKLAAVKLFVPSEYGMSTDGAAQEGPAGDKNKIAGATRYVGIPSLRFFEHQQISSFNLLEHYTDESLVGVFIEFVPKGEMPVSFTSIADIAGACKNVIPSRMH